MGSVLSAAPATSGEVSAPKHAHYRRPLIVGCIVGAMILSILMSGLNFDNRHHGLDDAYITYRYALNLSQGNGFVFNAGDSPVQGSSTPLYTFVLALGARMGADIPTFSLVLNVIGTAIALGVIIAIAGDLGFLAAGVATALTWATSPYSWWYVEGMETPVYIALIVGAIYLALHGHRRTSLTLAALAILTRLDGLAVFAAIIALFVVQRKWSWRDVVPGAVLLVGWFALAMYWFGTVLPASGLAKIIYVPGVSSRFTLGSSAFVQLALPITNCLALSPTTMSWAILGALGGCAVILFRRRAVMVLLAWYGFYVAGFTLWHLPDFVWYDAPIALVSCFLLWCGLQQCFSFLSQRLTGGLDFAAPAAMVILALAMAALVLQVAPAWRVSRAGELLPRDAAGAWLAQHARKTDTLVAFETGTVAYVSGLKTVDLLGLTEPSARAALKKGDYSWAIQQLPTYVFTPENKGRWPVIDAIFNSPSFALNYEPAARFLFRDGQDYVLYRRVQQPTTTLVGNPWAVRWVDAYYPTSVISGSIGNYSIVLTNLSDMSWPSDGDRPIHVGYHWSDLGGGSVTAPDMRTALPVTVGPGQSVVVSALLVAPARPGRYNLQWDIVREGVDWFSHRGFAAPVGVVEVH